MSSTLQARADVVIIGAGIAGLWLMRRLRRDGRRVVLLESHQIGRGQTVASQGIIHGGTKYALTNRITGASEAIRAMPSRWKAALAGEGEIDLSGARVLSDCQHLWSQHSLPSRITTFFAASVMKTRVRSVARAQYPALLAPSAFRGSVYRIDEVVLDVPSLIARLAADARGLVLRVNGDDTSIDTCADDRSGVECRVRFTDGEQVREARIRAGAVVCTAGGGSAALLEKTGAGPSLIQRRPLHMVLARGPIEHPIFGHCLETGSTPRLTITSHDWDEDPRRRVWYLGGELAESGVARSRIDQITAAQREVATLFPWLDLSQLQWDAFRIDRVEGAQADQARPDRPVIHEVGSVLFAWPTKLAFAPLLADLLIERINRLVPDRSPGGLESLADWPQPQMALPPWKESRQWHTFDHSDAPV